MRSIILIVHNVRSAHNVGSLLRTADGLGIERVYFTGYTPYPALENDNRLPHLRDKIERQIDKTALGAQKSVPWRHAEHIGDVIKKLKADNFVIAALEQTAKAKSLPKFKPHGNIALVVGNEVEGLDNEVLALADIHLQIPMLGAKESFNVAVSGAIALYHLNNF